MPHEPVFTQASNLCTVQGRIREDGEDGEERREDILSVMSREDRVSSRLAESGHMVGAKRCVKSGLSKELFCSSCPVCPPTKADHVLTMRLRDEHVLWRKIRQRMAPSPSH
jgi:hypothetical protein